MPEQKSVNVDQNTDVELTDRVIDGERQVTLSMRYEEYLLDESKAKKMGEALLEVTD